MPLVDIIGGALLLTIGRKIFWFFVAASGFFAGLEVATRFLNIKPDWAALLIALAVGLAGALLAYFFQRLIIGVAGFLAGAFIMARLVSYLGTQVKSWNWILVVIGGIIGIVLVYAIFEWALIILSSLAGSILVVEGLKLAGAIGFTVGLILFAAGLVFQSGLNKRHGSRKKLKA